MCRCGGGGAVVGLVCVGAVVAAQLYLRNITPISEELAPARWDSSRLAEFFPAERGLGACPLRVRAHPQARVCNAVIPFVLRRCCVGVLSWLGCSASL